MPAESSSVVIPTYNEAENIRALVSVLLELPCDLRVIVVDDNSPDGTGRIVDELAASSSRVAPVHRPWKLGLGTAHIAGFRKALEMGSTLVLSMDADFSHPPSAVPALLARMSEVDVCIGSRYVPGGGSVGCSALRRALSHGANAFARSMLRLGAHDCTAGFRCYRRVVLETVGLDSVFSNGYSFLIEMLYRARRQGYRIGESPIIFENRRLGSSKISRREIAKAMYTVLRLRWPRLPWDRWLAVRARTASACERSP